MHSNISSVALCPLDFVDHFISGHEFKSYLYPSHIPVTLSLIYVYLNLPHPRMRVNY